MPSVTQIVFQTKKLKKFFKEALRNGIKLFCNGGKDKAKLLQLLSASTVPRSPPPGFWQE